MRKDFLRRLAKLEAKSTLFPVTGVFWMEFVAKDRRDTLAIHERIVEDWYLRSNNNIMFVRERVTADPSDTGLNYRRPNPGTDFEPDHSRLRRETTTVGKTQFKGILRES
jgi:hypothetical protein